jgi:PPOX class probable F420-dependent enzyme
MARLDISMSPDEIDRFLSALHTAVLSTLARTGFPHMVGMWFVHTGDEVRMWTYGKSQKVQNLRRDPRCALLIEHGDSYNELRGVLIRSEAQIIDDRRVVVEVGTALYRRYSLPASGEAAQRSPEAEIDRQAAKRVVLALAMERLVSWDHSKLR